MTRFYEVTDKLNYGILASIIAISMIFLAPTMATQVYQNVHINGTGSVESSFVNDDLCYEHVVYIDGDAYLNVSYDDGAEKLLQVENYITANEPAWTADARGIGMDDVANALDQAAKYKLGEVDHIDDNQQSILNSLDAITTARLNQFYDQNIKQINDALNYQQSEIQSNSYEIEALYRTLEKTNGDTYCQSRMEVAKTHNLASVKCGLHSKKCYNGDIYKQEGGQDFCVHLEPYIDYLPCYNMQGRCGTVDSVEILDSEVNSYTPIKVTFTNPGVTTLHPNISIEVQEPNTYEVFKKDTQDLGEVLPGETKTFTVYFDNSGLTAGYTYTILTTVSSGRKEVLDKSEYILKPEGTFQKSGTLIVAPFVLSYMKTSEITGTFTNTADNAYPVVMTADVFLEGKKIKSVSSNQVAVIPGESKDMTVEFKPEVEGNYTINVRIEGTDLEQTFKAEVAKPTVTGLFMGAVAKAPENEFANFQGTVNTSSTTATLGAAILLVCLVSTVIYWRKSKATAAVPVKYSHKIAAAKKR